MRQWQVGEKPPESRFDQTFRFAVAAIFVVAAAVSLFVAPVPLARLLTYTSLGILAGILMSVGDFVGVVGLLIVAGVSTRGFTSPDDQSLLPMLQPGLLALAGVGVVALVPAIRRLMQSRTNVT